MAGINGTTPQEQLAMVAQQYQQLASLTGQQNGVIDSVNYRFLTADGADGARAFKISGKNLKLAIFDENNPWFYYRATDANGNELPMKLCKFEVCDMPKAETDLVTMADLNSLRDSLRDDLKNDIRSMLEPFLTAKHVANDADLTGKEKTG